MNRRDRSGEALSNRLESDVTQIEGIVEIVSIPAFEELPWLFDMERGQKLAISLMASQEVDIVVCAERDYDDWVESGMDADRPEYGFLELRCGTQHSVQFRSPVNGLVVVLVVNASGIDAEIAISLSESPPPASAVPSGT